MIDFVDMHDLGDMLVESGFEIPVMDQETLTVTYKSPDSLLADVRRLGAYPFERGAPGHASRRLRAALYDALEARRRDDGTIPLTFEVIYGMHGRRRRARRRRASASCACRTSAKGGRSVRDAVKRGFRYAGN